MYLILSSLVSNLYFFPFIPAHINQYLLIYFSRFKKKYHYFEGIEFSTTVEYCKSAKKALSMHINKTARIKAMIKLV